MALFLPEYMMLWDVYEKTPEMQKMDFDEYMDREREPRKKVTFAQMLKDFFI